VLVKTTQDLDRLMTEDKMENGPMISVVMPVYNVEKYLDKAVESVLNQTYSNLELILVDDCSTDGSGIKCDNWAKQDSRIRVVHKPENEGPGEARNKGIDLALGSYIMFLDSDDWVETSLMEKMYSAAKKDSCDVVICGYYQDFLDTEDQKKYSIPVTSQEFKACGLKQVAAAVIKLDESKLFSFSYNKLYNTKLIKENGIRFSRAMHSEDFFFNITFFSCVKSLTVIDDALCHYNKPARQTLTSSYVKGYYGLINQRFEAEATLLDKAEVYHDDVRASLCNIHIKHIFSALERDCWPESEMNFSQRHRAVKKIIKHPNTLVALDNSKASARSSRILNFVLKTRNPLLITIFAWLLWFSKMKTPRLFDKVK
jgi:glycosyltransferase involved in cell wall biosynthesis